MTRKHTATIWCSFNVLHSFPVVLWTATTYFLISPCIFFFCYRFCLHFHLPAFICLFPFPHFSFFSLLQGRKTDRTYGWVKVIQVLAYQNLPIKKVIPYCFQCSSVSVSLGFLFLIIWFPLRFSFPLVKPCIKPMLTFDFYSW